jgi:hypothetical protein
MGTTAGNYGVPHCGGPINQFFRAKVIRSAATAQLAEPPKAIFRHSICVRFEQPVDFGTPSFTTEHHKIIEVSHHHSP